MDVNVGNFSDPEDLPGLAHCVEHMLFMGTKKVQIIVKFRDLVAECMDHQHGISSPYQAIF